MKSQIGQHCSLCSNGAYVRVGFFSRLTTYSTAIGEWRVSSVVSQLNALATSQAPREHRIWLPDSDRMNQSESLHDCRQCVMACSFQSNVQHSKFDRWRNGERILFRIYQSEREREKLFTSSPIAVYALANVCPPLSYYDSPLHFIESLFVTAPKTTRSEATELKIWYQRDISNTTGVESPGISDDLEASERKWL